MDEKNHTCENGGTHLRIFFLAFTDELEKQILKKLFKWANKKIILIFTMLYFFRRDRLKLVILSHFLPFYPPLKTQSIF